MIDVRSSTVVPAPIEAVWADLADLPTHSEWMLDAEEVRMVSDGELGVGSILEAETRLGPISLTDRLEVIEWRPDKAVAVRHAGIVSGQGRFTLERLGSDQTRLIWDEHLRFPFRLGGVVGERIAKPILSRVFRANLRSFSERHA